MAPFVYHLPHSEGGLDELAFVDQNGFGPPLKGDDIEENLIPLHKPIILPKLEKSTPQYQLAQSHLQGVFKQQGLKWKDSYSLQWSYQHYGLPDNSSAALLMLEYCKSVQKYLYRHIIGVDAFSIDWDVLRHKSKSKSKSIDGVKARIGRYNYFLLRIGVEDNNGDMFGPYLLSGKPVDRAVNFINFNNNRKFEARDSQIYLITGSTSLVSPFSEILHLITHETAMEHKRELNVQFSQQEAQSRARYLGETITESAAITLAKHYLTKIGHAERLVNVQTMEESLTKQLPSFKNSMRYMKEFSVQEALKIYNKDPQEFQIELDLS